MSKNHKGKNGGFMIKLASFIVDKRNLFFLIVIIGLVFSMFSQNWVEIENNLAFYLPDDSRSKQALDVMEEQFTTFGTADIMVANVSLEKAHELNEIISETEGVQSVVFDETTDHYNNVSALYTVTFDYDENNDECLVVLETLKEKLSAFDIYISTALGNTLSEIIDSEVSVIMVYVAIIVVIVLLLTSQTYAEVPVLLLTFVTAMILNSGTNFMLGKISFVSNSVTSILQLALSLDYAVILCNRFKEEHEKMPIREAVIVALSKAIPEISASSLTTIGGLIAMMFMQFKIGPDMAICLIKAIIFAILSVFIVMPGLLVLFGPWMDKTRHKNFVPKIPFVGKFAYATKYIIPPVFIVVLVLAANFSSECPYAYGYGNLETPKLNETQIAEQMIKDNFTETNFVALMVPTGDYETEAKMLAELEDYDEVDYTMGLANVEAMNGYMLTDKLTPRQFAELAGIDYEMAQLVYSAYAAKNSDYGDIISNLSGYQVPLIDMFLFVCDKIDSGLVSLDEEQTAMLSDAKTQMTNAKLQLQGSEYNRMLIYLNLPVSGNETYNFIDTIYGIAEKYYPDGNIYVVGDSTTEYDFKESFATDNTVVNIVSILIVLVVLLFIFKSAGMPILLILVIQGAIWINFSVPAITGTGLFFMSYLVVSSIQMGANIDYAIVIANRYNELKNEMSPKDAITETMNFAFPTIITSGTILAVAGTLIGKMTSEAAIVGIGQSIGRGTIISIILVMFVLPQVLLIGGKIVDKTSFKVPSVVKSKTASGKMKVDGYVKGEIHGNVVGRINATVDGDVNFNLISGTTEQQEGDDLNEKET
ncbi:MAG: RND family transporter [Acutalibacteraceae bacterium]